MLENFINYCFKQTKMYVLMQESLLAAENEIGFKKVEIEQLKQAKAVAETKVKEVKSMVKRIKSCTKDLGKGEPIKEIRSLCNRIIKED